MELVALAIAWVVIASVIAFSRQTRFHREQQTQLASQVQSNDPLVQVSRSEAAAAVIKQNRHAKQRGKQTCAICGEPNHPGHGCHIAAKIKLHKDWVKVGGRWRLRAAWHIVEVRDHYGELYQCDHRHKSRDKAAICRKTVVEGLKAGTLAPDYVVGPRPGATHQVARIPISDLPHYRWVSMMREADFHCAYCTEQFDPTRLEKEHDIPLARGGANSVSNIVVSCGPCNRQKATLTGEEYRELRRKTAGRTRGPKARSAAGPRAAPDWHSCECGGTFKLRSDRHGKFYGCSNYPRCRETRPLLRS